MKFEDIEIGKSYYFVDIQRLSTPELKSRNPCSNDINYRFIKDKALIKVINKDGSDKTVCVEYSIQDRSVDRYSKTGYSNWISCERLEELVGQNKLLKKFF